jgi:hypothetical protein
MKMTPILTVVALVTLWTMAPAVVGGAPAVADPQHLTLRLEDGLPRWEGAGMPVTIVVPVVSGKGGAGAGLASFVEYGPYHIDGSGLKVAGGRVTGTLTGRSRSGAATPVWTIGARIERGRITGTATAPAEGRNPAVNSRVMGYADPASGGQWIVECGMPWTDGGSHAKIAEDGGNYRACFLVRMRFDTSGGRLVYVNTPQEAPRRIQDQKIEGTAEAFAARITCIALDGKTPIRVNLKGGRIGRGGVVAAEVAVTEEARPGRSRPWKGHATVWAWPDAPGFTGGPEKDLENGSHDAEADPALTAAAKAEAAAPIHPVTPGEGEIWTHNVLQRTWPRCIAPPLFDIRPLPAADKYRLTVQRIRGTPITRADEDCTDPFAALAAAWPKPNPDDPKDMSHLGLHRYELSVGGKPMWAMEAWWGAKASKRPPAWLTPVIQAKQYRVTVTRDKEDKPAVETTVERPHEPLTAVWDRLSPGVYHLAVQGADDDGKPLGARPWRATFIKVHAFDGPYFTRPARPYEEAALALARWTADHPGLNEMRGHGIYNAPGSGDNGGCQIIFGAVWVGLSRYHLADDPNEREAGLMTAREACEHLRASCLARGGMPKTYKEGIANASLYGEAFLDMYAATGEQRWKDAALMVARAFAQSQLEGGTWAEGWKDPAIPAKLLKAGGAGAEMYRGILEAGLIPGIHGPHLAEYDCSEVLWFLGRARTELATDAFRDTEDKACQWVMENSVKPFFWRDQGHHSPCMVPPFEHTGRCSSYFALYLLEAAPPERRDLRLVAELMRYSENQHLDWSRGNAGDGAVRPNLVNANIRESGSAIWLGTRFALVWAKLGQRTGNPLHLAKARAIMDAITHAQHPQTGNVSPGMSRQIDFSRFATNQGRCAWNLRTYAETVKAR